MKHALDIHQKSRAKQEQKQEIRQAPRRPCDHLRYAQSLLPKYSAKANKKVSSCYPHSKPQVQVGSISLSLLIIEIILKENSKVAFESSRGKKSQFQKKVLYLTVGTKIEKREDGFYISKFLILCPRFRI